MKLLNLEVKLLKQEPAVIKTMCGHCGRTIVLKSENLRVTNYCTAC